ncbi:MAG: polysaccharide biosynthesis C-terminal domain-containing protein [Chitinophagaceae bacterium]|nr:polysaccharide biosynthesis C-terminal domain-containing protein [Chitinophagaceae bacterium]
MSIKSLASQTLWYGLSNILGRFLNYFLTLILFYIYKPEQIAGVMQVYVIVPFLNILFTLGLETSYFRFSQTVDKQKLFNTLNTFLFGSTIILTIIMILSNGGMTSLLDMQRNTTYYTWMIWLVAIDTLSTIPFAKLRHENRPQRFAAIKLLNIVINVVLVLFFLVLCPKLIASGSTIPTWLYHPAIGIGYFILANLAASIVTFFLLLPQWKGYVMQIDKGLLKQIMIYSYPIIIVGFGGMINDFLSRITYYKVLHNPLPELDREFGIFIANYKLAVLATLFIQVFKMGAEPFFFKQSGSKDAPATYARVTKIFSIICCVLFLFIAMNLDIFKLLIARKNVEYAEGIHIVPILTLANIFLGMYYNLSVWYKVTNNTMKGALITLIGVIITIALNIIFVPIFHYTGAAWATFFCYFTMLVISYIWGQKYYPIPYDVKNIFIYFGLVVGMYFLSTYLSNAMQIGGILYGIACFIIATIVFLFVAIKIDKTEFASLPLIGKYIS